MQLRELVDARAEFDFFAAELTRMLIAAGVGERQQLFSETLDIPGQSL